ncbi:MAG: 16S rRNA (guanine(527)-N(7))-methyltransferase RsmG [Clostridia bacterium]|nr:16S rRNA (guanine(527)-N(7))-methyltransferase RsmG [Clostridia bacterium]
MDFKTELKQVFLNYNIELNADQCEAFEKYYNLIKEWNEKFNLTTILEQHDVIIKHFLDSVLIINDLKENSKLIDVGAGAGFPSVPIKIMRPDLEVVMLDGSNKRITFLNEVIAQLNLKNISAVHERCEIAAHKPEFRENFDYCVARAVAESNVLCEYCLPFVKLFGYMVAYKSRNINEELGNAKNAIEILGGKLTDIKNTYIEEIDAERNLVFIQKKFKTPVKYPRGQNKPRLNPLN